MICAHIGSGVGSITIKLDTKTQAVNKKMLTIR